MGDINLTTPFDSGDININSGDDLNLSAGDGNINLNSGTRYKNAEVATVNDIPVVISRSAYNTLTPTQQASKIYFIYEDTNSSAS